MSSSKKRKERDESSSSSPSASKSRSSSSSDRHHKSKSSHKKKSSRKSKDSHKSHSKSHSSASSAAISHIDENDFFKKSIEFRIWLQNSKHVAFDKLSSKDARHWFRKFVKRWNRSQLDASFYGGTLQPADLIPAAGKSAWGFAAKLDKHEIDSLRDRVARDTKVMTLGTGTSATTASASTAAAAVQSTNSAASRELDYDERKKLEKYQNKQFDKRREAALDEVAPKLEGREKERAARREKGAYSRPQDDGEFLTAGADVGGGGNDDELQRMLAKERARKEARESARATHNTNVLDTHNARESQVMNQFQQLLSNQSVDPSTGRMMIKPRG